MSLPPASGNGKNVPADMVPTVAAPQSSVPRRARCMGFVPGSASHVADDIQDLLRKRLRLGGAIALIGFLSYFVRGLFVPDPGFTALDRSYQGAVVAILIAGTALLYSHVPLGLRSLRILEAVLFGSMVLFFAYLQVKVFQEGEVLKWAKEDAVHKERIVALATVANAMRWFILLVLYGTFIPNTWQRCTLVIGAMMAIPLALLFLVCTVCPFMHVFGGTILFHSLVILTLGGAIAVFGSYKIAELHQQAIEGKKLGQYVLEKQLGSGGMGQVHLGRHVLLRRKCAIKIIRPDLASDPVNRQRFEREVHAMAQLTHWNSVEIYDYGSTEDGTFYYVMEYLPGLTLEEMVEKYGPMSPSRAVYFLRQLCGALKEAHNIHLIHRDIKPSNVIVCRRGGMDDVAKLLDFGLVQDLNFNQPNERLTMHGSVLGSPLYISPEQAINKAPVDGRTDIYCLGGLAYFLLTGKAPFVRETIMEVLMAHLHDAVEPIGTIRSDVPADVEEIVLKCLQKKPEQRYADVAELDRALAKCSVAGLWDAEQASAWWRERAESRFATKPISLTDTKDETPGTAPANVDANKVTLTLPSSVLAVK